MLGESRGRSQRTTPVEGDLRLLVTPSGREGRAVSRVVPGTKEPVLFSSPWRTIRSIAWTM